MPRILAKSRVFRSLGELCSSKISDFGCLRNFRDMPTHPLLIPDLFYAADVAGVLLSLCRYFRLSLATMPKLRLKIMRPKLHPGKTYIIRFAIIMQWLYGRIKN